MGRYVGYCDYGNNLTIEDCEQPASEVLVFMLSSLKKAWKWPIGYWFVDKIKSSVQAQLIRIAVSECQKYGINVLSVTCDGAYANFSSFQILGCNLNQTFEDLKPHFNIDPNTPNIYLTPDACHNIKLARNALGTFKAFKDEDGNLIEWRYIEQLSKLQSKIGFIFANKLSTSHINWNANSMKVKLAVQTLSSSVADSLQYLKNTSDDFKNCDPTIKFIRIVDEIFDFLNSRNPFAKGHKQPIRSNNIVYLENRMTQLIKYLYSLKTVDGVDLWKSRRKTFILGFATAIKSILEISKKLLANQIFLYILTYKFSQDYIELFFGHIRGRFGHNDNPNCLQFKYALRSILLHISIKQSTGNCSLLTSHEDSLFSLKWKYKKNEHVLENEEQVQLITDNCNNPILNSLTDNVLYYIAGYVIKKLLPVLTCEKCIKAVTDDSYVQDHTYCTVENESFKTLTRMKNRGGLELASESVFRVIKTTEAYFKSVVSDKQQLMSKNVDTKIILWVQNTLALSATLFPESKDCWYVTDIHARPHKIKLINLISHTYLNIRLHSYSKILTSSIMKVASKRQKLHKTILFYNM